MAPLRHLAAFALAVILMAAACGDDYDEAATTTTTTTTTTTATTTPTVDDGDVALTQSCTHEDRDVRIVVRYPEGWYAADGQGVQSCTAFAPEPIELRPGTEFPRDLGVVLRVEPVAFARAATGAGRSMEDERRLMIHGRRAVRQEAVTTGEGLGPAGLRLVRYVVDGGTDRSIIATTHDVEGNDFSRSIEFAMAAAFDIDPRNG